MKYLKQNQKEVIVNKHREFLEVLWYLYNGIATIKDLTETMILLNPSLSSISVSVELSELKENGFVRTLPLLNSNMKKIVVSSRTLGMLYNTKANLIPNFTNNDTLTVRNLFKGRLMSELIQEMRAEMKTGDKAVSCQSFINYLNRRHSSIHMRQGDILTYYQYLYHSHEKAFSPFLMDYYKYLDICDRYMKINFGKKADMELTPAELAYKDGIEKIKKKQNDYQNKREFYNIDNIFKTNGAVIKRIDFLENEVDIQLWYFETTSPATLPEKIADLCAYTYHFFRKILAGNPKVSVCCKVFCVNEESLHLSVKELNKTVFDIYTMRRKPYNKLENMLINRGILPTDLENISIETEDLMVEDIYRVAI